MLLESVGFPYASFEEVALDSPLEKTLRNRNQNAAYFVTDSLLPESIGINRSLCIPAFQGAARNITSRRDQCLNSLLGAYALSF